LISSLGQEAVPINTNAFVYDMSQTNPLDGVWPLATRKCWYANYNGPDKTL